MDCTWPIWYSFYAHFTCMAGLGEVCSHIAASWKPTQIWKLIRTSCTSLPSYWFPPAMQSLYPMHQLRRLTLPLHHERDGKCFKKSLIVVRKLYTKILLIPAILYPLIKNLKNFIKLCLRLANLQFCLSFLVTVKDTHLFKSIVHHLPLVISSEKNICQFCTQT